MLGFLRMLRDLKDGRIPDLQDSTPGRATPPPEPELVAPPGKVLIPGPTQVYEKDLSSPFWAAVAKMQPGSHVAYESIGREWHVFVVEEGPEYGRPEVLGDVSVVVRRVSTGQEFTMPAYRLTPCDPSFARRDGTRIKKGEGHRF